MSANPRSDQLANLWPSGDAAVACRARACSVPALTVILPCYNEAERLPGTLQALLAHLSAAPGEVEVLVVDDGSTDATVSVAEAVAAADRRVQVLSYRPNRGKGFAVRTGMLAARGELVVFTDADGSYSPSDLDRIVAALDQAPVAIGTRAGDASGPVARRAASRVFNLAIRGAVGLPFGDTQSGLKGFRRAAAQQIFSQARVDGFAFDVEVLWLVRQLELRSPRSGSSPWSVKAARSRCWPMPWKCLARSGRSGRRGPTAPTATWVRPRPYSLKRQPTLPVRRSQRRTRRLPYRPADRFDARRGIGEDEASGSADPDGLAVAAVLGLSRPPAAAATADRLDQTTCTTVAVLAYVAR
jgi:dolichyl-phosphate beta-glucosyltransferase